MIRKINIRLYLISLLFILFEFFSYTTVYAQTLSSDQQKDLMSTLSTYGDQAKTNYEFYVAGINCYENQLKRIAYFMDTKFTAFFYNDFHGNCMLSSIFLGTIPGQQPGGDICTISTSLFNELFTQWNLDAIKNFDESHKPNSDFVQFFTKIRACLLQHTLPISVAITQLKSSSQVTEKPE